MPSQADLTELESEAISALRELILACESYRQSFSDHRGIGTTESQALSYLLARGDLGQTELAHNLNISTSSATSLVDRLEASGLAERVRHPQDRRRAIVRLTESGSELVAESQLWLVNAFADVPQNKLSSTATLLSTLASSLRTRTGDLSPKR